jgi:segregation and condensation protein B
MNHVEAVLFAARHPVERSELARIVGSEASIDLLIEDIRANLQRKPCDVVSVAGGWQMRTRPAYAPGHWGVSGINHEAIIDPQ